MPVQQTAEKASGKLEAALEHLEKRLSEGMEFPDNEADAMAAANALLRVMVAQAEGILVLSRTQHAAAGSPNVRTMFEAWCDFRLILEQGDRNENGRRFRLFGLLELRDYALAARSEHEDYASEIAEVERLLSVYRERHAKLVAAMEAERKKRSNFWSGKSRTAMLKTLDKNEGTKPTLMDSYKVLSWDSHNSVTGVLDVNIEEDESGQIRVHFGHRQTPEDAGEFNCAVAERLLGDA